MGDLRMAKVRHGEEKKVGKVQALAALSYVPKTGYTLQSTRNPVLVEELRPRFPQAPPLNIRVCAERLPTGIEAKGKKVPKTGLVEGSVVIKTYGTLRCHPITHEANTWLTARGVQDLPAQMRFDEKYVQHMKNRNLKRGRFVNAAFAEWLFGFPQGFTSCKREGSPPAKARKVTSRSLSRKISAASVFSGCDGLARGLEDWITVCNYCELDPVPKELLENKIKGGLLAPAEVESDIREMDGKKLRKQGVKMIVGGFPCQDISISGNMVGFEGQRSSLFYELVRIAEEGRVPWLFLENVAAIVCQSMDGVLTSVLQTLNDKGYSTRYLCLCGNEIGCPMYRRRWFLLAKHKAADVEELRSLVPAPPSHEEWAKEVQKPWNLASKPPMTKWLLHEPTKDNSARLIMLGNAVVPQMSRRAMQLLVHDHCWP